MVRKGVKDLQKFVDLERKINIYVKFLFNYISFKVEQKVKVLKYAKILYFWPWGDKKENLCVDHESWKRLVVKDLLC